MDIFLIKPGISAGDLYLRVKIKPSKVFKRTGADLIIEKNITLLEALTGFAFNVEYFEGKQFKVMTMPGEVIKPGTIKTIKGKGMPFFKDSMGHGNLYVKFDVTFPKKGELKENQIQALKNILPGPKHDLSNIKDKEYLDDFHETDTNPNPEGGKNRDEEEEDPRGGGQRVQCAQQ